MEISFLFVQNPDHQTEYAVPESVLENKYDEEYEMFKYGIRDGNDNSYNMYNHTDEDETPEYKEVEPEYKHLEGEYKDIDLEFAKHKNIDYKELEFDGKATPNDNATIKKPPIAKKPTLLPPKCNVNRNIGSPTFSTFTSYLDSEDTYDIVADCTTMEPINPADLYAQVQK